jgi:dihydroneopterin aldolase
MKSTLTLNQLTLMVRLGWGQEEREVPQKVCLDLSIHFPILPKGCVTDELSDTHCYATLAKDLKKFCEKRSFKLLEHLTHELHHFIKTSLKGLPVDVTVTKFPPTQHLDHCTFSLKDE